MIARTSLLFLPVFLLAQEQAPPEVDQALRERVTGLFQNFLTSSFTPRKAEPFIAEDTKDYFYTAGKNQYESFKIGKIAYSDNFTKAVVIVEGRMQRMMAGQVMMMDVPQNTDWKIENGKWCWTYIEDKHSPLLISVPDSKNPPRPAAEAGTTAVKPKDMTPEGIRKAGLSVLQQQQMGLDKTSVTLSTTQEASSQVLFTNGADGEIQIALDGPMVRGLTAKLDKTTVPGHGTAVLAIHYDPSDKTGPKEAWEAKGNIPFRVVAAPFNRVFTVYVSFTGSK